MTIIDDQRNPLQGAPEWHSARAGKITASRIRDIIDRTAGGKYTQKRENYLWELFAERQTGMPAETYVNRVMQWGIDQEPAAKRLFTEITGEEIINTGFVNHPLFADFSGGSPDGLIGPETVVEIKCPKTTTHLAYFITGD